MSKKFNKVNLPHFKLIPLREVTLADFPVLIGEGVQLLDLSCTKWVCHYNLEGDVSGHLFVHDWTDVMQDINCKPYKIKAKVRGGNKTLAEKEWFVSSYQEANMAVIKAKKFLAQYVNAPQLTKFK